MIHGDLKIIDPDNLKPAIIKHDRIEIVMKSGHSTPKEVFTSQRCFLSPPP